MAGSLTPLCVWCVFSGQLYSAVCCRGPCCHLTRHPRGEETTDSTPHLQQVTYRFHFTLRGSANGACGGGAGAGSCKAISTATTSCHLPPPITEEVELE